MTKRSMFGVVQPMIDVSGIVQLLIDSSGIVQPLIDNSDIVEAFIDNSGIIQPTVDALRTHRTSVTSSCRRLLTQATDVYQIPIERQATKLYVSATITINLGNVTFM